MHDLDTTRRALWSIVYLVACVGVLVNLLGQAYSNALVICEMYPQFSFQETLLEEIAIHHTSLPLVRVHVPTLYLLGTSLVVYAAKKHWGVLNRGWVLLVDVLSGRWLYYQFLEVLPIYLLFKSTEPDVPELLSEDEVKDVDGNDASFDDIPLLPLDDKACNEALAKLVQVKMQHANRTVSRPDDWLVFDPVQDKLVLQKHTTCMDVDHKGFNKHNNGSKVDNWREQTPVGDSDQTLLCDVDAKCAGRMRTKGCRHTSSDQSISTSCNED